MAALLATALGIILVVVPLQGAVLAWHWRRAGRGIPPAALAATLAAGWFLILALRLSLERAWEGWIALSLLAALVAHLIDIRLRWR